MFLVKLQFNFGAGMRLLLLLLFDPVYKKKQQLELWRAHTPRATSMFMYELHPMGCTFVTDEQVNKAHGQP